jgi:hypothetical protein
MNWEVLSAISQIVSAVAVLATLGYLTIQIRQNTRQLYAQSMAAIESNFAQFRALIIQNAQVASLWRRALENLEQLTPDERTQADYLFTEYFWAWANMWEKMSGNRVARANWLETSVDIANHLQHAGMRQWWSIPQNRSLYFPGFAASVDALVRTCETKLPNMQLQPASVAANAEQVETTMSDARGCAADR